MAGEISSATMAFIRTNVGQARNDLAGGFTIARTMNNLAARLMADNDARCYGEQIHSFRMEKNMDNWTKAAIDEYLNILAETPAENRTREWVQA